MRAALIFVGDIRKRFVGRGRRREGFEEGPLSFLIHRDGVLKGLPVAALDGKGVSLEGIIVVKIRCSVDLCARGIGRVDPLEKRFDLFFIDRDLCVFVKNPIPIGQVLGEEFVGVV